MMEQTPIRIGLIGDTSEMSTELLAETRRALADLERCLNQDHSALEKQYLEGRMSESGGFDWYIDQNIVLHRRPMWKRVLRLPRLYHQYRNLGIQRLVAIRLAVNILRT